MGYREDVVFRRCGIAGKFCLIKQATLYFMKYLLFFVFLITINLKAQTDLKFDKRFVESEDRWVAFQIDKDSSYVYGFIYIDAQAGLTLNYEGSFKISSEGNFIPKKLDTINMKIRLEPNKVLVAFIPENRFAELQIQITPEWLKYYKTDTASVERLYKWGYMYNGWDECAKALTYLEKAKKINPNFKGLGVELAFSYNCLLQFDKAILVLRNALVSNPTDAYINKELIYAQIKSGQLDKASESCKNAISVCKDKTYNAENCYNLLHELYIKKDKENFNLWVDETKKWCSDNAKLLNSIKSMEEDIVK
jgi:tetratricopeptide (TPR) repeat protein